MKTKINFKHPVTNEVRQAPVGFSWTNFFFGCFVPLLRGDLKNAIIQLIFGLVSFGISLFVFPFMYNKTYIKTLLFKGFEASDEDSEKFLKIESF